MIDWKQTLAKNLKGISREKALGLLAEIRQAGITIFQPVIKQLTGGYQSQAINGYVIRQLAIRAGIIKNIK